MLEYAVKILQVGMPGFAFLMAFLGYQVLSKEGPNTRASNKRVQRYLLFCAALVVLVEAASIFDVAMKRSDPASVLRSCRDSLDRLDTLTKSPELTPAQLRAAVSSHV